LRSLRYELPGTGKSLTAEFAKKSRRERKDSGNGP
jgi:hypothetical protein